MPAVLRACAPVCGIEIVGATHGSPAFCSRFVLATEDVDTPTSEGAWNSGHPGPRPSGARCARVHLRSCSDVANLGQEIQPKAAKRTVVQTVTSATDQHCHNYQHFAFERERTGELSALDAFWTRIGEPEVIAQIRADEAHFLVSERTELFQVAVHESR